MLANDTWLESSAGILNLDNPNQITQRAYGNAVKGKYATSRSVATVLDWIYKGEISMNDSNLEGTARVSDHLDFYLEIIELTDVWDIPTLKTHIENRILRRADMFIRIENVSAVSEIVNLYNAKEVGKHCQAFMEINKAVVQRIDSEVCD